MTAGKNADMLRLACKTAHGMMHSFNHFFPKNLQHLPFNIWAAELLTTKCSSICNAVNSFECRQKFLKNTSSKQEIIF